jgi:Zn-finger nucleic acid-binding protein
MRTDENTITFLDQLEAVAKQHEISPNDRIVPPGQRECPICKKKMDVEETWEGATIDACQEHGVWLDAGELPRILARVRAGDHIDRRAAVEKARRDGKMSGWLFGAWSLLLD